MILLFSTLTKDVTVTIKSTLGPPEMAFICLSVASCVRDMLFVHSQFEQTHSLFLNFTVDCMAQPLNVSTGFCKGKYGSELYLVMIR